MRGKLISLTDRLDRLERQRGSTRRTEKFMDPTDGFEKEIIFFKQDDGTEVALGPHLARGDVEEFERYVAWWENQSVEQRELHACRWEAEYGAARK